MQNLALVTVGTGASITYFLDSRAGSYLRLQLGFLALGFETYAHAGRGMLEDLRGLEVALAYGREFRLSGDLWAGVALEVAGARLSDDDPQSGTALFTPTFRGSLTFF
jgi:hypothetical protein